MAVIYQADVFCDGCAEEIKSRICDDLWEEKRCDVGARCPDSAILLDFDSCDELDEYLRDMDEREYDSDSYPKYCSDDEESDCPQHCGGHAECVNAEVCSDGTKIGYFFGNSLTSEGADYVENAVREDVALGNFDSVACTEWFPYYTWLDYGDIGTCDECSKLADLNEWGNDEVCQDCIDRYGDNPCWRCPANGDDIACSQCAHGSSAY